MAKYFINFPKILHSYNGLSGTLITNLMTRIKLSDSVLENVLLYYKYDIQEGDTPEIVAEKYYGDAEKHWLVLMCNKIIDPFFEWPLTYQQFTLFINDKYGSQANAASTVHHYEKIIETTDGLTNLTTKNVYIIDLTAYNLMVAEPTIENRLLPNGNSVVVVTSRKMVDCLEYENALNESRRNIQLMNSNFAYQAETELKKLLNVEEL